MKFVDVEIWAGPDKDGHYSYSGTWWASYHPGHPLGEHRMALRGQCFSGPLDDVQAHAWRDTRPYQFGSLPLPLLEKVASSPDLNTAGALALLQGAARLARSGRGLRKLVHAARSLQRKKGRVA